MTQSLQSEVRLGAQGRLVIPSALRRALGFQEGDALVVRQENGRLILEKAEVIKQRLRARFASLDSQVSLADELLSERREEARQEQQR